MSERVLVRFKREQDHEGIVFEVGKTANVTPVDAAYFVGHGRAEYVTAEIKPEPKAPVNATDHRLPAAKRTYTRRNLTAEK